MTEKDKMLSGQMYNPDDPILVEERKSARMLFQKTNSLSEDYFEERTSLFYKLIGEAGEGLYIEPPFFCEYGYNIKCGNKVFINFNCIILDAMEVLMGNNVMIGPNVQIYTATHPMDFRSRNSGREFAKAIEIGSNVWIGGNAVICPGVNIGNGAVIGAGAVVTKNIPNDVFVAGNPAKIIRTIDNNNFEGKNLLQ
jgi:maltose O-acetyltransferase